ncbi:MAG: type I-E CRISPR-associated endoribonuclease Cas2 [Phycisphaerae bacterium]|nr:type I-E CRISPR-associated endoribonuclease Cas2 [Phycisphaerae bacterium]
MTVMILERVPPSLRGELTRWLIQPKTGVFVGRISARVRQLLWQRVVKSTKGGAAVLIHSDNSEQGFQVHTCGETSKIMVDFDGLILPKTPKTR